MAGWAGFLESSGGGGSGRRAALLAQMARLLAHRGRGAPRFHDDGMLALVFVGDGETDFAHDAGRTQVTACDGSVPGGDDAAHWPDAPRGAFALARWDAPRRRLLLARDALGLRPLVYAQAPGLLLFGSELKALLVHPGCPRRLDWSVLDDTREPLPTGLEGVCHLPAGHILEAAPGEPLVPRPRWTLPTSAPCSDESARAAVDVECAAALVAESVRAQVAGAGRVAVRVSGLASALTAACAAAAGAELLLCARVDEPGGLSSADAQALSRVLGSEVRPLAIGEGAAELTAEAALALLEWSVWLHDTPRVEPEDLLRHELGRHAGHAVTGAPVWLSDVGASLLADTPPVSARRRRLERHAVPGSLAPFLATTFPPGTAADDAGSDLAEALRGLQDEGLRGADRGAAALPGDVRHPWLDLRVVGLAARLCATPASAEALAHGRWLRDVGRRLLPGVSELPLLGDEAGDGAGAERLRRRLVERAFPAFHRRYLASGTASFSADAMVTAFRAACGVRAQPQLLRWLFRAMLLAVFERHCGASAEPPAPPAPLSLAALTAPARG